MGLARTLIEGGFEASLPELLEAALDAVDGAMARMASGKTGDGSKVAGVATASVAVPEWGGKFDARTIELYDFILDRLRGYYADRGVPAQQFSAVAALRPASLRDFDRRLEAIASFVRLPEAEALAAADKRIRNILRKAEGTVGDDVDAALLVEPAEQALSAAVEAAWAEAGPALDGGDHVAALARLARLRPEVDAFFDAVMVNADDPALRGNRLALLQRLAKRLGAVAELGQLST